MSIQKANAGNEKICTMSKIFIDTNILIYTMDQFDPVRQQKSRSRLRSLKNDLQGVISTQVMQEFYVTAVKKLNADPLIVKDILHDLERFETIIITPELIKEAIDCSIINHQCSPTESNVHPY